MNLSEYAIRLAHHIAHVSEKGLSDPIEWKAVANRFTHDDRSHMVEAAFELKSFGLIRVSQGMNVPDGISHIRAEYALYWIFDGDVFNYDVEADVVTLVELILADEKRGDAATLLSCIDWSPRRFNPAFARIIEEIPEGRVRKTLQTDYPSAGILITPEDRVALKALVQELSREPEAQFLKDDSSTADTHSQSEVTIKVPGTDMEISVPRKVGIGLSMLALFASVAWYWPDITQRFPFLSQGEQVQFENWSDNAGRRGIAQLTIPPNAERDRDIEIFAQYVALQDQPGDPWHQLIVSINGIQERATDKVGTSANEENKRPLRFIWSVPVNATLDIQAEVKNYRTQNESLLLEATELN